MENVPFIDALPSYKMGGSFHGLVNSDLPDPHHTNGTSDSWKTQIIH